MEQQEGLAKDVAFKFFYDRPPKGDAHVFHFYLYYVDDADPGRPDKKFHHEWKISGTEHHIAKDKDALIAQRKQENETAFRRNIAAELAAQGKRIVRRGDGSVHLVDD